MRSKGVVFLFSRPGERTRRLLVTKRLFLGAAFFACFAITSGFWAGWQIGKVTSSIQQTSYGR